jgi:hypothetical protein
LAGSSSRVPQSAATALPLALTQNLRCWQNEPRFCTDRVGGSFPICRASRMLRPSARQTGPPRARCNSWGWQPGQDR